MVKKANIKRKSNKERIAVIGSGISGLTTAFLLSKKYTVELYEKNSYFGGHACTIKSKLSSHNGKKDTIHFDIGFLVFNDKNYPNFRKLLNFFKVNCEKSDMSFSVTDKDNLFEYGSRCIMAFSNNFKNFFSISFWTMLVDILRFNYKSKKLILNNYQNSMTVKGFLNKNKFSKSFTLKYFTPMCGAIWSTSQMNVMKMPIYSILFFLNNHGLLNLFKRPKWRTIKNGSSNYVKKIIHSLNGNVIKNKKVEKVIRYKKYCSVEGTNFKRKYKKVIFATHSEDVLKILKHPNNLEKSFFSSEFYQSNTIYVHRDRRLMPKNEKVWSSWNVILNEDSLMRRKEPNMICVTYWINRLQNISGYEDVYVTLNPPRKLLPKKSKTIKVLKMKHPLIKNDRRELLKNLKNLQGKDKIYYVGAWTGYGFHEDGVNSAINVAELFGIDFNEAL